MSRALLRRLVEPAALLRLVSEATRHRILEALRGGNRTVGELVAALVDEQSNVSHHLATLRQAGLVTCRRAGRQQVYSLAAPEVARLLDEVRALAARLDQVAYSNLLGLSSDPAFQGYG